jgi:hypothetical protein
MPPAFNVTRAVDINKSTKATNTLYQSALKGQGGGIWQYYQLVMTQWPLQLNPPNPIPPTQNGSPANTFPGNGATSAFANTTLETFDQNNVGTSCMACHTITQTATDFLYSLKDHAFPAKVPNLLMQDPEVRALTNLIQTSREQQLSTDKKTKPSLKTKATPSPHK